MAFKIEIVNTALSVTNTVSGDIEVFQPSTFTWYQEDSLKGGFVKFYGITDQSEKNTNKYEYNKVGNSFSGYPITDCIDSNDVVFTAETFREFASVSLGKPSPAIGANQILVNQNNYTATLGGVIDSTKEYFLDGIIDMGSIEITIPIGGISIRGYNFDLSGLISSEDNYTMFKSETDIIGSGDVLFYDFKIEVTGTSSKVYDIYDKDGTNAIELSRINYNNCTSLGDIHNYRQGLETGTGRFGGSPSLTLHGAWLGGFRITTSITRGMSDTTTAPLFCSGVDFVMQSRFLTDMNVDLGDLQPFFDFNDTNFPNPSTLELRDVILTRGGVISANDPNTTPNIGASNLSCDWRGNNGVNNTFVGGIATVTAEIETSVSQNLPFILLGTFTNTDLQHFDSPANGQLRHLGNNPREYTVNFDFVLDGGQNREYKIELVKNDGVATTVYQQTRVINNLQGGRDVAYYTGLANVIMNKDEYIYWQVTNLSSNDSCTLELDSSWSVEER